MWYCVVERVDASAKQIVDNMSAISQRLREHVGQHGFPPKPRILVKMAVQGIQHRPSKRRKVTVAAAAASAAINPEVVHEDGQAANDSDNDEDSVNDGDNDEDSVYWACRRYLSALRSVRKRLDDAVANDDMVEAAALKLEVARVKDQLAELRVCGICYVERPTSKAEKHGPESWYGSKKMLICSFCGKDANVPELGQDHRDKSIQSLKLRAWYELKLSSDRLPDSVTKHLRKTLKEYERNMRVSLGHGRGVRWESKDVSMATLCGILSRTCERLACEPELRKQWGALRLSLQALALR